MTMLAPRVIAWRELSQAALQDEWAQLAQAWALGEMRLLYVEEEVWVIEAGRYVDWARYMRRGLERRLRMYGYGRVDLCFVVGNEPWLRKDPGEAVKSAEIAHGVRLPARERGQVASKNKGERGNWWE